MQQRGQHLFLGVLLGLGVLGCGQVLDTAQPDPAQDAGPADSGGGSSDAGRVDAAVDARVDATSDAGALDAGCTDSAQCDDGIVCDGVERCVDGACVPGDPLVCDDDLACTEDSCSEAEGGCKFQPVDSLCAGSPEAQICSPADGGCVVATRCTSDSGCPTSNCAGVWACVGNICSVVRVPAVPSTECITTECLPGDSRADVQGWVVTRDVGVCDDDRSCTLDRCTVGGSCAHTLVNTRCGDSWDCTLDLCAPGDPSADESGCVNQNTDSLCTDHADCTGDVCDPSLAADSSGCVYTPIPAFCDDGASCTRDSCTPGTMFSEPDGCLYTPVDSDCGGVLLAGRCMALVCAPPASPDVPGTGCAGEWTPRACMLGAGRFYCDMLGACNLDGLREGCTTNAECDDRNPCNGVETCRLRGGGGGLCVQASEGCPASGISCQLAVCDTSAGVPTCATRPDPACYPPLP
ncbi:MAG: hypothetical protein GXP55_11835 [Deltaproteobacteria bacterium]|nr:hypothetical protein [Deltaproteobacteria bacterium]